MLLTRVIPAPVDAVDTADEAARAWIDAAYAPPAGAFVRMNMIASLTGSAAGSDGTSDTLTSPVDRMVLRAVRAASDVVVVGAQSVRAEGYIVPRTTRLAIVTASGRLDGHRLRLEGDDASRVVVLCPAGRAAAVRETTAALGLELLPVPGDDDLAPTEIVRVLAERGWRRIVCEGGPTLASQFARARIVDEYCVTVAPRITPVAAPFLRVDVDVPTETAGHLVDAAGFSYLRLRPRA
jgi:riboflavin biosynthesis pyrimidine reductase